MALCWTWGFEVVFKYNLMQFLSRPLWRHSCGKRPRLATSQSPSGVEFKGHSHNFQTKIDLLSLDVKSEGGGLRGREGLPSFKRVSLPPIGSKQLMRCGFLGLCCQTSHSTWGKTEQPGKRESGPVVVCSREEGGRSPDCEWHTVRSGWEVYLNNIISQSFFKICHDTLYFFGNTWNVLIIHIKCSVKFKTNWGFFAIVRSPSYYCWLIATMI